MEYTLTGQFLEACDCTVICPCWVDDDPVGGHCTGFILWEFQRVEENKDSTITDDMSSPHNVTGCRVVSVSTHSGKRRDESPTTTVIYVDTAGTATDRESEQRLVDLLGQAFAGEAGGPLEDLAVVSGTVVDVQQAHIDIHQVTDLKAPWTVAVAKCVRSDDLGHENCKTDKRIVVRADGKPKIFDEQDLRDAGVADPPSLVLKNTALSHELRAVGEVQAEQGHLLAINVGALPGGSLEVTGRSGMRGKFTYKYSDPVPVNAEAAQ